MGNLWYISQMKDFLRLVTFGLVFISPFILLIVSGSMFFPFITGKNFAFRIVVEVLVASWLLLVLYEPAYRPRLSYILYSILGLVGVMFVANLFGESPHKSFWSNYERMEGWVTLVHFLFYFIVLSSVLTTEKLWNRFFNTALVVATIMSCFALAQMANFYEVSQGTQWRVDGRFGNSSYLGVYMLFHIFIAGWMILRSKTNQLKTFYGGLALLFVFILSQTGTRGAVYGLIGGVVLSFIYLALLSKGGAVVKKWALGGLLVFVLLVAGVWVARDTEFVKNNPALDRFAGTTLAEGNIRFTVWQMALEGVKERPFLGWGQENFNFVFNKYYDPALYGAEPWYDRTHNIFFDWLIAGGVLGLLSYLAILLSALFYTILKPVLAFLRGEEGEGTFSVYEQALILGLLAAYTFQNLFVFDNIGSWMFYGVVLALIHSRVSTSWKSVFAYKVDRETIERVAAPVVAVSLVLAVYFTNVPSILAAKDIIKSYLATSASGQIEGFEQAYERGGFGNQEVYEQYTLVGARIVTAPSVSEEDKQDATTLFQKLRSKMLETRGSDARMYVISSNFYRYVGDLNSAMDDLNKAEELSPGKQAIKEDQGTIYIMAGRGEDAVNRFETAYNLDTSNQEGLVKLAAAYLFAGQEEEFNKIASSDALEDNQSLSYIFVQEPLVAQIAYQQKRYDLLEFIMLERTKLDPKNRTHWVNLATIYVERKEYDKAREVVLMAMDNVPGFEEEGELLLEEIENQS